ncbi:tellurite resistance TerB family protein [Motilimonas sp. KMU-193]|uniref:tellurite resistance TerB family protein n=1 Tax=Motilimonas sp. KMU-193 TaxID=3388668 RepID=UPI00396B3BD0
MKSLLNSLIKAGSDYLESDSGNKNKGKHIAQGAALGGLATMLLGNKKIKKMSKKLGKNALTLGGTAAIGGAAYYAWSKWKESQGSGQSASVSLSEEQKAPVLLQAMIFAAKSDGHIDEQERANIDNALSAMALDVDTDAAIRRWLNAPLDANALAAQVNDLEFASEVYMASLLAIEVDHFMERAYLDELAKALKLPEELKFNLEQEIERAE